MLSQILEKFNKLPISNKSLIYLMSIYNFGALISNIFITIYVYKLNNSLENLIIYASITHCCIFIGFFGVGTLASIFCVNTKYFFLASYTFFICSLINLFIIGNTEIGVYIYGVLQGFGLGLFWNAIHTRELLNIADKNRDFYSSSLSFGENGLRILTPFFVSFIFILGTYLHIDGYKIIFCIVPFVYLLSFKYILGTGDYIPKKIQRKDFAHCLNFKKYKFGNLYFFLDGIQDAIIMIIMPLVSYFILKNEITIGFFEGFFGILSAILIMYISMKRNTENRFFYYGFFSLIFSLSFIVFGLFFHLYGYILFSLLGIIIKPLFGVSNHIYNLSLMDNMQEKNDFYPAMLFREMLLFSGRIGSLLIFFLLVKLYNIPLDYILRGGLITIGVLYLFLLLAIYGWEKNEKSTLKY